MELLSVLGVVVSLKKVGNSWLKDCQLLMDVYTKLL